MGSIPNIVQHAISYHCAKFGAFAIKPTIMSPFCRTKLVCGLQNMQIQRRLLSKAKLKYSKALEIAIVMEAAVHDASELHSELHTELRVDKISENRKPPPPPPAAEPHT